MKLHIAASYGNMKPTPEQVRSKVPGCLLCSPVLCWISMNKSSSLSLSRSHLVKLYQLELKGIIGAPPAKVKHAFFCLVGPRHWRLSRVGLKQDSRQRALIYEHGRERREKYVPLPESSETRLTQSPRTCWGGTLNDVYRCDGVRIQPRREAANQVIRLNCKSVKSRIHHVRSRTSPAKGERENRCAEPSG